MGKEVRSEAQRIKRNRRRHRRPPDLEVSVLDEPMTEVQESHATEELCVVIKYICSNTSHQYIFYLLYKTLKIILYIYNIPCHSAILSSMQNFIMMFMNLIPSNYLLIHTCSILETFETDF